jgi:hypothetical protein
MGTMTYDGAIIEFEDRLLTHLNVVIMQKFRRGQSFPMSWLEPAAAGSGRSSFWLTPTLPIYFKFSGSRVPAIDQEWVDRLMESADSPRGLIVTLADGTLAHSLSMVRRPTAI